MKIITAIVDTRKNDEDLALTPYLSLMHEKKSKTYGLGLCWLFYGLAIGLSFNWPKNRGTLLIDI